MKVCNRCGFEHDGLDGVNYCRDCERKKIKSAQAKERRAAMKEAMESLGLVKVRGALGGTYWE